MYVYEVLFSANPVFASEKPFETLDSSFSSLIFRKIYFASVPFILGSSWRVTVYTPHLHSLPFSSVIFSLTLLIVLFFFPHSLEGRKSFLDLMFYCRITCRIWSLRSYFILCQHHFFSLICSLLTPFELFTAFHPVGYLFILHLLFLKMFLFFKDISESSNRRYSTLLKFICVSFYYFTYFSKVLFSYMVSFATFWKSRNLQVLSYSSLIVECRRVSPGLVNGHNEMGWIPPPLRCSNAHLNGPEH